VWQWQFDVAAVSGLVGLLGVPPGDARGPAEIRQDLLDYLPLPAIELEDLNGDVYVVKMIGYEEQNVEQFDPAHPEGGWLVRVRFAQTQPV
jgi:hypothetical protein